MIVTVVVLFVWYFETFPAKLAFRKVIRRFRNEVVISNRRYLIRFRILRKMNSIEGRKFLNLILYNSAMPWDGFGFGCISLENNV